MKIVLYSIIISAFLACGGTTTSSSGLKKDDSLLSSNVLGNVLVVEGMKKDVKVTASKDGVTYSIVNKKDISQDIEINKNNGWVNFWANDSVGSMVTVVVQAEDKSGWKSKPFNLVFQTISKNIAVTKKVIKTGSISDGGAGADRDFVVTGKYIKDPFGNVWENKLDKKSSKASLYQLAENRCMILKSINRGSNWRLPTADELLNIVDYNRSASTISMLDSAFEQSNLNIWIKSKDNKYQYFSQASGLIFPSNKAMARYSVRCINAKKESEHHIISSGVSIGADTYDFSTGLVWSSMSKDSKRKIVDSVEENASVYCANYDNANGWRLPNINEVHSLIEGNRISHSVLGGSSTIVVSSTPYNKVKNYVVGLGKDGILYSFSDFDKTYYITCVKEIP